VATGALQALPTQAWGMLRSERDQGAPSEGCGAPPGVTALEEQPECCLCMERFEETDEVRVLPCAHYFHKNCIDRWFATKRYQSRACPLCKRNPIAGHEATAPDEEEGEAMAAAGEASSSDAELGQPFTGSRPAEGYPARGPVVVFESADAQQATLEDVSSHNSSEEGGISASQPPSASNTEPTPVAAAPPSSSSEPQCVAQ